ncbi:ribonuclease H-like domain-containing protein [Tanacetum coccineum]
MCDKNNNILFTDTGCFVLSPDFKLADESQNRVLVVKPHNKTPYELFRGRTLALSFQGDHLVSCDGPKWLFGIDVLTQSMNSVLVVAGKNSNVAGTEESFSAGHSNKETGSSQDYIMMPLWKDDSLFDSSSKNASDAKPQPSSDIEKKDDEGVSKDSGLDDQERPANNTQDDNDVGPKDPKNWQSLSDSAWVEAMQEELLQFKLQQMSSIGELTFFLGLQVKQKEDGIFISQDKYVADILRKFGFTDVRTASTPVDTEKPLLKDSDGDDVDVHLYRSMIGSLMYLVRY